MIPLECVPAYRCFVSTVIWNPWVEQSKELSDFGDDEFPNMVCVEAGHVSSPVVLLPGTAFEASQILQVSAAHCYDSFKYFSPVFP